MIDVEYCRLLARYNRWMNERMYAALAAMPDDERKRDRGAFFGSIHRTLDHILWGDRAWLGRFTGAPHAVAAYGADAHADFAALAREREEADRDILGWAGALTDAWLASTLEYRASSDGKLRRVPAWIAATHLFLHATHHRGQVTTLMKQAGVDPGVTDLPYLSRRDVDPGVIVRPAAVVALRAETLDYAEAESSPAAAAATHPGGAVPLLRAASSVAVLFVFWVMLSGYFTPFLLGAGLASSIGVVWLVRRMDMLDREGHPIEFSLRATSYWPWLVKEIAKSAWDVTKVILSPRLPIEPALVRFRPSQRTEIGLVTHANSITLTPGTITIDAGHDEFLVHALTSASAAGVADGGMDARVTKFELLFMMAAAAAAILVTLALAIVRAIRGPTVFDRAQAGNTIGTMAVMLLAVIGFLNGRPEFLDLAIVYGLLNLVGTIAVLKFFRYGDLGDPGDEPPRQP